MRSLLISAALLSAPLLASPARSAPPQGAAGDGSDPTAESKAAPESAEVTAEPAPSADVKSADETEPHQDSKTSDATTSPGTAAKENEKQRLPKEGGCPPASARTKDPCPEKEPETPYSGPRPLLPSSKEKMSYGGYGGLTVLATGVQGQAAMLIGGEGGFLMNHRFVLGIGGYGLTSMVNVDRYANGDDALLLMGYGGPIIRYQFFGNGPLVLSVGALFGGGGLGFLRETYDENWEIEEDYSTGQVFFVMEPSIQGHVQLTRWMRLGINLNYRAIQGVATRGVDDRGLSGFAGGGHLQFGWF